MRAIGIKLDFVGVAFDMLTNGDQNMRQLRSEEIRIFDTEVSGDSA